LQLFLGLLEVHILISGRELSCNRDLYISNATAIDLIPIVLSNLMYKNWSLLQGVSSVGQKPYTAVMIVPTGTGATIGGFAGDALPVARALASVVDCLITHPNVSNIYCMMHSFDPLLIDTILGQHVELSMVNLFSGT
jgi:hypothetical protein